MTLKVACLGAGYFSQFHYEAWSRIDQAQLTGACDHDLSRAKATGLPAYTDLERMLETKPDILDIIIPPEGHLEAIKTAIDAEIPTVVCQKPFCTTLDQARTATSLAANSNTTLIVHENFRFQPWYRTIHAALQAGKIGTTQQITFRLRPGDGQGPDAYLNRQPYFQKMPRFLVHETGVHFIDVFNYLLGPASAVYADLRRLNPAIKGEDAGYVIFDHANDTRAIFDGNRHLDHNAKNTRTTLGEALIEGTTGTITMSGDGSVTLRQFGQTTTETLLAATTASSFGGDCVHALQSHVVDYILNGTCPENSAADYLNVLETEDAIYRSAMSGKKIQLSESPIRKEKGGLN